MNSAKCIPCISSFDSHPKPLRKVILCLCLHLQKLKLGIVTHFSKVKYVTSGRVKIPL